MGDLIARLREIPVWMVGAMTPGWQDHGTTAYEAADELTALRERVAELEGAIGIILGGKKSEAGTWMEMVEPLIARFDVAANFGGNAVHNPDGSAALAELIRQMGTRLDASVGVARAILSRPQQGRE